MISEKFSSELNAIRWIAAFFVVISHVRNLLFIDYSQVVRKNLSVEAFYFLTGMGHEAVVVFFVVSGFLVGGIAARKLRSGRFDAQDFVIHRFSRIYIVLIPALLAGYAFDHAGLLFFDDASLYSHSERYRLNGILSSQMGWDTFSGNALMLQGIFVTVAGSNGPLWSLSYEWWYYCLFFFALMLASSGNATHTRLACCIALVAVAAFLPLEILAWFLIWLIGVAIAFFPASRKALPVWLAGCVFIATLAWSRVDHAHAAHLMSRNLVRDSAVAIGCFLLLTSLSRSRGGKPRAWKLHRTMAEFSYTTYLAHFPFMVFAVSFLNSAFGVAFFRQPTAGNFAYFLLLLISIYLYTYLFSLLTEKHTQRLRASLRSAFDRHPRKAAAVSPASSDLASGAPKTD